MSVNHLAWYWY